MCFSLPNVSVDIEFEAASGIAMRDEFFVTALMLLTPRASSNIRLRLRRQQREILDGQDNGQLGSLSVYI
jgi:hypothetical protein